MSAGPLLRLRSDEQLVRLFREGSEDAFRVIHDRYRPRLFAYARQMLSGSRQDAEDALQDVFVRAYAALRASDREISLRAWLYRVAHNRCIDELRRPAPPPPEALELMRPPASDPIAATEQRESLRRLVADVRRLPEQQRSALLMREIVGLPYRDLAVALDVTVPAVKSLLVRARVGLADAAAARDTACVQIREQLADAHERGVRAGGLARRHLHDCADCSAYRRELRATHARFAALTPALGPGALLAKLLGIGGGGAGASAGAGAGGAATAGGAGTALGGVSASHVVAAVAAAVVGAGGAVEVQQTLVASHHAHRPTAIVRSATDARLAPHALPAKHAGAGARTLPPAGTVDPQAMVPAVPATGPINGGAAAPADPSAAPPPAVGTPGESTTGVDPTGDPSGTTGSGPAQGDTPPPDGGTAASGPPAGGSAPGALAGEGSAPSNTTAAPHSTTR